MFRGKEFDIQIKRAREVEGVQIELNGNHINGNAIRLEEAQQKNSVNIFISL